MGMVASILMVLAGTVTVGQDPAEKRVFVLPHVLEAVNKAIEIPAPVGQNAADQASFAAQTEWLKTVRSRIEPLVAQSQVRPPRDPAAGQLSEKRQHGNVVIIKEWEPLQRTFEQEGRRFDTLKGDLKARHDLAMNAIRNLKG